MQRYPSLNGLRAISIGIVVVCHLYVRNGMFTQLSKITWFRPVFRLITDGQLGVNIFFVISGFLITSLMLKEEERSGAISIKKFYIRRSLRIFPAYFFLLFIYSLLQIFRFIYIPRMAWLTAFTYTKYFNWYIDTYTGHLWSLSVEEHFYLTWPLIFAAGPKIRKFLAVFLIFAVPLLRIYVAPENWFYQLTIFTRIDAIATGCFFALYKSEILAAVKPYMRSLFTVSFAMLFLLAYFTDQSNTAPHSALYAALGTTFGTLANFSVALIMMYSIFGPRGLWFRMLNSSLANYIGLLSYSIYLWQQIFIIQPAGMFTRFPVNLLCTIACSLFSYYLIERPFLKIKYIFR